MSLKQTENQSKKGKRDFEAISLYFLMLLGSLWLLSIAVKAIMRGTHFDLKVFLVILLFLFFVIFLGKSLVVEVFRIEEKSSSNKSNFWPMVFSLIPIAIGIALLYSVTIRDSNKLLLLQKQKYVEINGIIKNQPKNTRSRGLSTYIYINKYPEFSFNFKGLSLSNRLSYIFNEEVKKGDSIKVLVREEEFNKKIRNTEPLNFIDKHFGYDNIEVYDLHINSIHYLSLGRTINLLANRGFGIGSFLALMGAIVLIAFGVVIILAITGRLEKSIKLLQFLKRTRK